MDLPEIKKLLDAIPRDIRIKIQNCESNTSLD